MYATAPAIVDGVGNMQQDITHFGCMPCYLPLANGACSETVYLHYRTNNKGGVIPLAAGSDNKKAEYIVGSASCNQIFGLNVGTGDFYFPIAKFAPDPKFSC